ncbi:hypothetical protein [Brevibacillus sp. NRS-1366]|uniref:hypothetical protein n=1 Tax=Brevibacillus sp. NRS-1366 TaxID=3233899 RepID=UPI003D24070C
MKLGLISLTLLLLVEGNSVDSHHDISPQKSTKTPMIIQLTENCVTKVDEYDPALKWNDTRYIKDYESDTKNLERGTKLSEVSLKLNGNVCPGYRMQNGDATWAEIGTPIYQVKGYSAKFRLFVGDELYEANESPDAKKMGELFDVAGKVKKVTLEYYDENTERYAVDFSEKDSKQFTDHFLTLDYVPFDEMIEKLPENRKSEFVIRFVLDDHSSFHVLYWFDDNAFTRGFGNDTIQSLVKKYAGKAKKIPSPSDQ